MIKINAAARLKAAHKKITNSDYARDYLFLKHGFRTKPIEESSYVKGWGAHVRGKHTEPAVALWESAATKLCHDFKKVNDRFSRGTYSDPASKTQWEVTIEKSGSGAELNFNRLNAGITDSLYI